MSPPQEVKMLRLFDKKSRVFLDINKPLIRIGRDEDNDLILNEDSVSGFHAELFYKNGRMEIKDLGSTNGTWHNNSQVEGRAWVTAGDILRFGDKIMELVDTNEPRRVSESMQDNMTKTAIKAATLHQATGNILAILDFTSGEKGPSRIEIRKNTTIGRMPGNDIVLDIPTVSDNHAQIIAAGDRLEVVDLGSTNGTYVNDRKVRHQALHHGDRVRFDEVEYMVKINTSVFGLSPPEESSRNIIDVPYDRISTMESDKTIQQSSTVTGNAYINRQPARSIAPSHDISVYGGFWIRVGATIIDGLVLFLPLTFVSALLYAITMPTDEIDVLRTDAIHMIISLIAWWIYSAVLHSSVWQATVGKKALGLKVVDEYGDRISFARATGRHFSEYVSSLFLGIGYLMVAWTRRKQGLHDMMAGTYVVKVGG